MASLHARRKHASIPDGSSVPIGGSSDHSDEEKQIRSRFRLLLDADTKIAVTLFGLFVLAGLLLGTTFLHHHHRKVILHTIRDPWGHGRAAIHHLTRRQHPQGFHHHFFSGAPRFVTVLMPSVVNPAGRKERLKAIHDTWGPYGRAIYVVHDNTEFPPAAKHQTIATSSKPWDRFMYPQNLLLPKTIGVDDGVPRLMYAIRTIYKQVNPDFAFFANDHTYVISSHLCKYLEDNDPSVDLYAGHALKNKDDLFNSGAAGYILSRATMQKLIEKWDAMDAHCVVPSAQSGHPEMKWLQGNPGLLTVSCLSSMGVHAIDTRESGRFHRFHAFPLTRLTTGLVDEWYIRKHQIHTIPNNFFDLSYETLLKGPDCCSKETISFHYVEAKEQKALFAVRGMLLKSMHTSDKELKDFVIQHWPADKKELGFYSHALPKIDDDIRWSWLLKTLRKISTRDTMGDC